MDRYQILRSDALSCTLVKSVIEALRRQYARCDLDAWFADELHGIERICRKLEPLTAFNEKISNVAVSAYAEGASGGGELVRALTLCNEVKARAGGVTWTVLEDSRRVGRQGRMWDDWNFQFSADITPIGLSTHVFISKEAGVYNDTDKRQECFQRIIELWGLEDQLAIDLRDDGFIITAKAPLKTHHIVVGGVDPWDLRVIGLSSLEQAIGAAKAARDGLAGQVLETRFGCSLTQEQYESLHPQFNALRTGWNIEVRGSLTKEADSILRGGELTETSPAWVPALRWYNDDDSGKVLVSVVIEEGQRYLEVATYDGTLEMLQQRVAFLQDVRFTPVFP